MLKVRFDTLAPGSLFDAGSVKGYTKIGMQEKGNYGRVNAVGPAQYVADLGFRYFHDEQLVTPVTPVKDAQAPTRASVARDGRAIIDAIERLYSDLEKVQPPLDHIARQRFNDASAVIDDAVTAMAHRPPGSASGKALCDMDNLATSSTSSQRLARR